MKDQIHPQALNDNHILCVEEYTLIIRPQRISLFERMLYCTRMNNEKPFLFKRLDTVFNKKKMTYISWGMGCSLQRDLCLT